MKSTFSILFIIKRKAVKINGTAPLLCRITLNGTSCSFSCRVYVKPSLWDAKQGQAVGNNADSRRINREIAKIRKDVNSHYDKIFHGIGPLTAERVRHSYLGFDRSCRTLLQVFQNHNHDYIGLVENGIRHKATYERYVMVYRLLSDFLRKTYKLKDIAFVDIRSSFITDFEMYLRKKGYANNTVCIYITPLRKMISIAQNNGWIDCNPFANYHVPLQRRGREHLTLAEIECLLNIDLKQGRGNIEFIRDLFVFCIFTGVSYIDMVNLTNENVKQQDNDIWISFTRQKTNIVCEIPLLRIPLAILEKYKGVQKGKFLFEVPSYTGLLYGIRKVARLCGIERHITWHVARHTFATEICLANGVPIETISKMLGHTDVKTTRIYAQTSRSIVKQDMACLAERLKHL